MAKVLKSDPIADKGIGILEEAGFDVIYSIKASEDELESILLLPMNNNVTGYGFWHNDGDKAGYRMYLNNDVGSLFLRKTKKPYESKTYIIASCLLSTPFFTITKQGGCIK